MHEKINHIIHEVTPLSDKDCFYIADRMKSEFTYPLHSHSELEINYIENAEGVRRIVGDSVEEIGKYDLTLIAGEELEHVWEQHKCTSKNIREITIQFSKEIFFSSLIHKNQFNSIRTLLDNAQKGVNFPMSSIMKIYPMLDSLSGDQSGFHSMIKLMTILYELSLCDNYRTLASSSYANIVNTTDSRRVRKIYEHINNHFQEEIRLEELANIISMTPVALCRFFKLRTGKTVSDYIIDTRLGNATRLLVDTTNSIAEICYDSGFNNLSNFNRLFKKRKGCSPTEFRENYRKTRIII